MAENKVHQGSLIVFPGQTLDVGYTEVTGQIRVDRGAKLNAPALLSVCGDSARDGNCLSGSRFHARLKRRGDIMGMMSLGSFLEEKNE